MRASTRTLLSQGFLTGIIGYALVAGSYVVMNTLAGRAPLSTAAALGHALFGNGGMPASPAADPGPLIAYNGVHLLFFVLIGIAAAWLIAEAELHPRLWYLVAFAFIAGFIYSYFAVVVAVAELSVEISPWSIVAANLAAAAGMGIYLAQVHPDLGRRIELQADPDAAPATRAAAA